MKCLIAVRDLPDKDYDAWFKRLRDDRYEKLLTDWAWWRRADQCPPAGDWHVWMLLAGRGFGKTRTGAEWVRAFAEATPGARIALVAASLHEARQVMVEGESGLLAIAPEARRPDYESSLRRLTWPNGAVATLYSAAEPDSLRGPEHEAAWCDEIAKWPQGEAAWDNLMLTMRIGVRPQVVATTTPRGVPLVRRLINEAGVAVTRGTTASNRLNLSPRWQATMAAIYGGTRLGRQELDGELLEDVEGALWSRALIERCRVDADSVGKLVRVVIGVDPPASAQGDACGIVVAALLRDGRIAVVHVKALHPLDDHYGAGCLIETLAEDKRGLRVVARLTHPTAAGLVARGALTGLSFGYRVTAARGGNPRELLGLELAEVSLVAMPMQPLARVIAVESTKE